MDGLRHPANGKIRSSYEKTDIDRERDLAWSRAMEWAPIRILPPVE